MNLLFRYEFPDQADRNLGQILDEISAPAGYYGFTDFYVALAPGSNPVRRGSTGAFVAETIPSTTENQSPLTSWVSGNGSNVLLAATTPTGCAVLICLIGKS